MSTCKCGLMKITIKTAAPGISVQLGCPVCKTTAEARQ